MTHQDIYTKFMIEYDKANVTSSYPSLTEYEVATVLDKAYNALIAQKVTGNNVRRSTFESDIKAIADLAPLVTTDSAPNRSNINTHAKNTWTFTVPSDMLYFLQASLKYDNSGKEFEKYGDGVQYNPADGLETRALPVKLVNHEIAQKFFSSAFNLPWIKEPVCYIENGVITVVYDPMDKPIDDDLEIVYIRKPNVFAKDLDAIDKYIETVKNRDPRDLETKTWFFVDSSDPVLKKEIIDKYYTFECNETVAEELISLAVAFALENVESQRLNSKLNMRGLEA